MAGDRTASAHPIAAQNRRTDRAACRGAGDAGNPRQRASAYHNQGNGHGGSGHLSLLCGLAQQNLRRNQSVRAVNVQLYAARTGWSVRTDHPVEWAADDGGVEDRAGASMREHGYPQAGGADAVDRAAPWRVTPGSWNSRWRGKHRDWLRRDRGRGHRQPPGHRQSCIHRIHRGRETDSSGLRRKS